MPPGNPDDKTLLTQFTDGIGEQNPVFVQLLGMCPTLAITTAVLNGLTMGLATTFVLVGSNVVVSLIRRRLQPHLRILVYTLTIAAFVTIAFYYLRARYYPMSVTLGPYVPLIIVNCIIISRVESCASKSGPVRSLIDALGMGAGFTLALMLLGAVREVLGSGTLCGFRVLSAGHENWVVMVLPAGAFLTLGILIGISNVIRDRRKAGSAS